MDWENLPIDELYDFISQTLSSTAREVLGTTTSKARPRMTDKIRGHLLKAQKLNRELKDMQAGPEKNAARIAVRDAFHNFRMKLQRHKKLTTEEFLLQQADCNGQEAWKKYKKVQNQIQPR